VRRHVEPNRSTIDADAVDADRAVLTSFMLRFPPLHHHFSGAHLSTTTATSLLISDNIAAGRWKGRLAMAMNFKIIQLKSKNSIHLALDGDFDGSSAHELINTLKSCRRDAGKVVIDTSGLTSVHPFGQTVLYQNLSGLYGRCDNVVFSGDHRRQLSRPWDS
jgi:hypothetical protein